MARVAYVNGRYEAMRAAHVGVEDRGLQFGDGVYEVVLAQGAALVDEARHLDRLDRSLAKLSLVSPMPRGALRRVLLEVVRRNRIGDGLIYVQVTRGAARREHRFPPEDTRPTLIVTARRLPPMPADVTCWAAAAITRPDERWARCDIKSVNLLPNVLAKQAAWEAGAAEAILVDAAGMVTEGASTTVWIVDASGAPRTRHLDARILPGCTREALLGIAGAYGAGVQERGFSVAELRAAREVFLTSATSYVRPITRIDGTLVADGTVGPVTRALFDAYRRVLRRDPPPPEALAMLAA